MNTIIRPTRERLLHQLYEAAELEHTLMCTYLYAAFSLKQDEVDGLSDVEVATVRSWRRTILDIAVEEMGHLVAVWNITSALGGSPRLGRANFPLDPGWLPAGVVVKLAPFNEAVLQHFIHLERPNGADERDGIGFEPPIRFKRQVGAARITPMPMDYETVGEFYAALDSELHEFVDVMGEGAAFCGDPLLQLTSSEIDLKGAQKVICLKTASAAFRAIIEQGEGAPTDSADSHFRRFVTIRDELERMKASNPHFSPSFPAAWNPLLRTPVREGQRVWIENEVAAETVDAANASYMLMLRLLAFAYAIPSSWPEKALAVDLAVSLMRAVTLLAERAARLPAGPSHPGCNAGMSFTALRDTAPLPPRPSAGRFFRERFHELSAAIGTLADSSDGRALAATRIVNELSERASRGFAFDTLASADRNN